MVPLFCFGLSWGRRAAGGASDASVLELLILHHSQKQHTVELVHQSLPAEPELCPNCCTARCLQPRACTYFEVETKLETA